MAFFRLRSCLLFIIFPCLFCPAQDWNETVAPLANTSPENFEVIYRGKASFSKQFQLRLYGNAFYNISDIDTSDMDAEDWGVAHADMKGYMVGGEVKIRKTVWGVYYQAAYNNQEWADFLKEEVKNQAIGLTYQKLFGFGHFLVNVNGGMDEYAFPNPINPGLKFDGKQANAYTELGLSVPIGSLSIKPFGGLHYNYLQHDSVTFLDEYEFEKEDFNGLNALIGARGNMKWGGWGVQVRASWIYDCFSGSPTYKTYYGGYSGVMTPTQWSVMGNTDRNWYWLGAGLKWTLGKNLSIFGDYDLMKNAKLESHLLSIGLRLSF